MIRPYHLCLWGPRDGVAGRLWQQASEALARRDDIRLSDTTPDVVVITDPAWQETAPPAVLHVQYPWGVDLPAEAAGPVWAASRWHQKHLPGSARVPIGALLHDARPAPPANGGPILIVSPDDGHPPEPLLERLDGYGLWLCQQAVDGDVLTLPLGADDRRALWSAASAVVLLPGCEASLSLALEIRSVGVPVLVPKGDPADELLMVAGIGAYGVRLGELPEPDWAALFLRIDRMAEQDFQVRPADLSGWHWDRWCDRVVAQLDTLGLRPPESGMGGAGDASPVAGLGDRAAVVVVDATDGVWLVERVLRPLWGRATAPVDVVVSGELPRLAAGIASLLTEPERSASWSQVTFWPAGASPASLADRLQQVPVRLAGPTISPVWAAWVRERDAEAGTMVLDANNVR